MTTQATPVRETTPDRLPHGDSSDTSTQPTMAGCLLALFLGETLGDHDRRTLDDLFPEHCLTFLVRDGAWIHPADLPLFDFSTLDSLIEQCGPAIMTHQYHPERSDAELYSVQTAILNPDDQPTIVFGMIGPHQLRRDSDLSNRFEKTVADLRITWQTLRPTFVRIREALLGATPHLVVGTDDERILAANDTYCETVGRTREELLATRYSDVQELMAGGTTAVKIDHGLLNLTLLSLRRDEVTVVSGGDDVTDAAVKAKDVAPSDETNTISQATKNLQRAVSDLESLTRTVADSLTRGIIHTISRHTEVLRSRLENLPSMLSGVETTDGIENNRHNI